MDDIEQQIAEIEKLKEKQALHRRQLEENRQRALEKKSSTKHLIILGKIISDLFPDLRLMSEEKAKDFLEKKTEKQNSAHCKKVD